MKRMNGRESIKRSAAWLAGCVAAVMVFAALAADAASVADEIKALKAVIASNSVNRLSKECRYYKAYYRELCTEAEREAILDRNVAAHRRWIELEGKGRDALPRAELGKVLAIGGRWAEAEKELTEALKSDFDRNRMAEARWALAECLWHRGDKDGAKKIVADIVAVTEKTDKRYGDGSVWEKARFMHRAWTDPDGDVDDLKFPHTVDCKPFPTPQEARYGEKKVSLAKVELKVKGVGDADPIVRLLKRKFTRFGTKFENGGTPIEIELSPNAPVDKPQGYSIDVAKGKVVVKARDRLGLTWGVVSLIQCVDRDESAICECKIRDWPKLERRGVIEAIWKADFLEVALFEKMSSLVVKIGRPELSFIFSGLELERARITLERYIDFGIVPYWSSRELSVHPALPFSAKRTRDLHLQWFRWAAQFGGNVCFEMDDERFFDFPEVDKKAFGSATNMDSKYITSLYREVKKEFPNFRLIFGTPFYFGPDGAAGGSWYPEEREPYLKSHREFLDPEIDVYWSGPRVKSIAFTVPKIQWMTDIIGRKPVVYHNSDCVWRHGHCNYGADVAGYKASHCPETLDMIGGLYVNMTHYPEAPKVGTAMDWCWNPDAHDAEVATRRAVEQFEGPGVFEVLAAAIPQISYLDKYIGGARSELFTEDQAMLDKIAADGEDAWKRVRALAKNGGMSVAAFKTTALHRAKQMASFRRDPPKWLKERIEAENSNKSYAKEEIGFDESKGDQFFPAGMLQGGRWHGKITDASGRAPCGVKELKIGDTVSGKFTLEPFPPEQTPKLIVTCMAFVEAWDKDFKVDMPDAEVEINGKVVWRGKMFADGLFKPCEIDLPVVSLTRTSTFAIRWTGPEVEHQRRPMIHYVVVRK